MNPKLNYPRCCIIKLAVSCVFVGTSYFAHALPIRPINCATKDKYQPFKDIIHRASIISEDGRGKLRELGPKLSLNGEDLSLTAVEIDQLEKSVGSLHCPGTKFGNPYFGNAVVVGFNGQISVNSHALVDELGRLRSPLSDCVFSTSGPNPQKIKLKISEGSIILGTRDWENDENNDRATVLLERPVEGLSSIIPVDPTADLLSDGSAIIVVSGPKMIGPGFKQFSEQESMVQACKSKKKYNAKYDDGGNFVHGAVAITDCDSYPGMSASLALGRNGNGQLVAAGILVGSAKEDKDGQEYSVEKRNFTKFIALDSNFVSEIQAVNDVKEIRAAQVRQSPTRHSN